MHRHHGDHSRKYQHDFYFDFDDDSGQPWRKRGRKRPRHSRRRDYETTTRRDRFEWLEELDDE